MSKIEIDTNNAPEELFKGVDAWTRKTSVTVGGVNLLVLGMITGCGIAQMHGVARIPSSVTKEELMAAMTPIKRSGNGGVLATLGYGYYSQHSKLIKLGFEQLLEYPNYRHCMAGSYTQRLYILKL